MKPDVLAISAPMRGVLRRLRVPCAKPVRVAFAFSQTPPTQNYGYTLDLPPGEPAIAPGTGTIVQILQENATWRSTSPSANDTTTSYGVVIDHGQGIRTVVHGLQFLNPLGSQTVQRGTVLGVPLTTQVFFGIQIGGVYVDPAQVNRGFVSQDSNLVPGQGGFLRPAPATFVRTPGALGSALYAGLRVFFSLPAAPVLYSVDFNGNGTKAGPAAAGVSPTDFWNVYSPVNFNSAIQYQCGTAVKSFNIAPVFPLSDYTGVPTPVWLERSDPLLSTAGSGASWDPMLATWIGGYSGSTPVSNTFTLRNLAPGTYSVYCYANEVGPGSQTTTFMAAVDGGTPSTKTVAATVTPAFLQDQNYSLFSVTLAAGDRLSINAQGFWNGLQVYKTA